MKLRTLPWRLWRWWRRRRGLCTHNDRMLVVFDEETSGTVCNDCDEVVETWPTPAWVRAYLEERERLGLSARTSDHAVSPPPA